MPQGLCHICQSNDEQSSMCAIAGDSIRMKCSVVLLSLLLVALVSSASAASRPRRMLLDACEDKCQREYDANVRKCIADTKLGEPPVIKTFAYVPPKDTALQLAEQKCEELQAPQLEACKAKCKPADTGNDCKKCDERYGADTQQAKWCRVAKGC